MLTFCEACSDCYFYFLSSLINSCLVRVVFHVTVLSETQPACVSSLFHDID